MSAGTEFRHVGMHATPETRSANGRACVGAAQALHRRRQALRSSLATKLPRTNLTAGDPPTPRPATYAVTARLHILAETGKCLARRLGRTGCRCGPAVWSNRRGPRSGRTGQSKLRSGAEQVATTSICRGRRSASAGTAVEGDSVASVWIPCDPRRPPSIRCLSDLRFLALVRGWQPAACLAGRCQAGQDAEGQSRPLPCRHSRRVISNFV
jgi:hypothetical protein